MDNNIKASLYLDWDGVVNFFGSRNAYRKHSKLGYLRRGSASPLPEVRYNVPYVYGPYPMQWSAELLRKLAALPVEVVFLSTWRHSFSELLKATDWDLDNYRVLDWVDGPRGKEHSGKVPALINDALIANRPFIWADDEAHEFFSAEDRLKLSNLPSLLLAPDENVGLTDRDLEAMSNFLDSL